MNQRDFETHGTTPGRYSYSSTTMGLRGRATELFQLVKMTRSPVSESVERTLQTVKNTEERALQLTGVVLRDLKALDIGPGQMLRHMRCFAVKNDIVGIDTDIIPQGLNLSEYLRMVRTNPLMRSVKTLARKALGRDARFTQALAHALGVSRLPDLKVLRMSATAMTFADSNFDFVCSYSVFEHIDDPRAALLEVKRVLRPGGVAYISVHLYSSHSGAHDPSIMAQGRPTEPFWPHLRPEFEGSLQPSTYLNRVALAEWRKIFSETMPGVHFINERQDAEIGDGLRKLRAQGELAAFTDEELMTVNFIGVWQKPTQNIA